VINLTVSVLMSSAVKNSIYSIINSSVAIPSKYIQISIMKMYINKSCAIVMQMSCIEMFTSNSCCSRELNICYEV